MYRQSLRNHTHSGTFPKTPAKALKLLAPDVQLVEDNTQGELITLRLRVRSARQALYMVVYMEGEPEIQSVSIAGVEVDQGREIEFWALPAEGLEVTYVLDASGPIEVRAVDRSFGFPAELGAPTRPSWVVPAPGLSSEAVLVSKGFVFP